MKILNYLKRFFIFKRHIYSYDVLGNGAELSFHAKHSLMHPDFNAQIHRDLIALIVIDGYTARLGVILAFFNNHYDLTIDEFVVLSYKLGMLVQLYINNPVYLMEDALLYQDMFSEETIKDIQKNLKNMKLRDENEMKQKFEEFRIKTEQNKANKRGITENDEANKKIDEYLKNKEK